MASPTLTSTPLADGFSMPAEWQPHRQTWMIWPERPDNWRLGGKPAQHAFAAVARAIAQFEPVTLGVSAAQYDNAAAQLAGEPDIRLVELSNNDAWMRDTGPTFVRNAQGEIRGVDWIFNAWGGLQGGLYFPWDKDDQVARKVLQIENLPRYRSSFVLEGGAIHVDGEGTLLTTEACLLNPNRNPHMDREAIEMAMREYLGIEKVLWLPRGIVDDETDEHIDNMACFIGPAEVLLAWTDDTQDPQYAHSQAALEYLSQQTDAKGRSLTIHKLPVPGPLYMTAEEAAGVDPIDATQPRQAGNRLAASYINFLFCNGGIVMPAFDDPMDEVARKLVAELCPQHRVIQVPGREILLGGGNIHCITQQQPA
ncbi:Agmatine deiminase [Nitrincola lacisaponensis]|uniref:Putative agmatine deiminase n=1 Tax=Nitrincola lacisaponensis TaxID=267850 RepID=A0A063Y9F7_9GAMM|nr:agmatine deiminase [Nitrincola lacisaponensis]KDE41356.1 Agmatine deiminase [Nitrincola lacisaponensis]